MCSKAFAPSPGSAVHAGGALRALATPKPRLSTKTHRRNIVVMRPILPPAVTRFD
jgi:hypothetical protein